MINLEETVIRKLKTIQHILVTVESCTGGLISHLITNTPGASEVYWGSFIVYDNQAKEQLGVSSETLNTHGAVSAKIALQLAEKGLMKAENALSHVTPSQSLIKHKGILCISTTGIAGPQGGSLEKPVGLCFLGLAITGKPTRVEKIPEIMNCAKCGANETNRVKTNENFT